MFKYSSDFLERAFSNFFFLLNLQKISNNFKQFQIMENKNLLIVNDDALRALVVESVEEYFVKRGWLQEKPSSDEEEWITRDEVCDKLHITYTTLWRKEKEGIIKKRKIGRRNLYSKEEIMALIETKNLM